jgi:hypothetical protein
MKRFFTVLILTFVIFQGFSQVSQTDKEMIKLGWTLTSPLILNKINDRLTKEIVINTIPKIIDQDAEAAVIEVLGSISKVKNIKVLNKEYLILLKKNITIAISSIQKKDYVTSVNELLKGALMTDNYIRNGILDKADSKSQSTTAVANTDLIEKTIVNSKLYLGKNNDYMFFIPKGTFSELNKNATPNSFNNELFSIKLDLGYEIKLLVEKTQSNDFKQTTIASLISNKDESKKLKDKVLNNLSLSLGSGIILNTGIADVQNFKALKYNYKYIDKFTSTPSMAFIIVAFHNSTMFQMSFCLSENDFPLAKKSIDEILENFFIIGYDELENNSNINSNLGNEKKLIITQTENNDCESNKTGSIIVFNNSLNPYDIFIDGVFVVRLAGKTKSEKITIKEGNDRKLYAKQVSGYALYPTEKNSKMNIIRCSDYNWQVPH